jgi:hypothetical protein
LTQSEEEELRNLEKDAFEIHPKVIAETYYPKKRKLQTEENAINTRIKELRKKRDECRNNAQNTQLERQLIMNLHDIRYSIDSRLDSVKQGFLSPDLIEWNHVPALEFEIFTHSNRKVKINLRRLFSYTLWQEILAHPLQMHTVIVERGGGYLNGKPLGYFIDRNARLDKVQVIQETFLAIRLV